MPNSTSPPVSEGIQRAEETPVALQLSHAGKAELQRRLTAHRADPSTSIPWDEVRASLFKGRARG